MPPAPARRPRIAFAGTPEFAARALDALATFDCDIPLVLTQPDRPAGRGMKLMPSPVKQRALAHGLTVAQPETLKTPELRAPLVGRALRPLIQASLESFFSPQRHSGVA